MVWILLSDTHPAGVEAMAGISPSQKKGDYVFTTNRKK
jgi:hypothetical protein